jgi:ATP-dependent Lon protease
MTGEITLQGFVLPVGGIKEKCLAAVRNKIKRIVLPFQNKYDVDELTPETKKPLKFIFVKDIKEVIQNVFYGNIIEDKTFMVKHSPKF